jgi:hypothetical protein
VQRVVAAKTIIRTLKANAQRGEQSQNILTMATVYTYRDSREGGKPAKLKFLAQQGHTRKAFKIKLLFRPDYV